MFPPVPASSGGDTMKALVHLPDPPPLPLQHERPFGEERFEALDPSMPLTFVSSVRLEVGWEVGIWVPCATCYRNRLDPNLHSGGPTRSAVVATSTITEAERIPIVRAGGNYPDPTDKAVYRYSLGPLRECPPITDLPEGASMLKEGDVWLLESQS